MVAEYFVYLKRIIEKLFEKIKSKNTDMSNVK